MQKPKLSGYRSLFWPVLLIGVGVVWLMSNLGVLAADSVWRLFSLWPILLIALGLDLIFGRRSALVGGLIGVITMAVVVVLLLAGPALGFPAQPQVQTQHLNVPLEGVQSAVVDLNLSSYSSTISALKDSTALFDADITYAGTLQFDASGTGGQKRITLRHSNLGSGWFPFSGLTGDKRWYIGISPNVPLEFRVDVGSGSAEIDLSGLKLTTLNVIGGSGSTRMILPVSAKAYTVDYNGSSGSLNMTLPGETPINLRLEGGSGSLTLTLPSGSAVRVEVRDNGSGSVSVGGGLPRISGSGGDDKGVWESASYAQAANKISIIVDQVGSGSISMR